MVNEVKERTREKKKERSNDETMRNNRICDTYDTILYNKCDWKRTIG